MIPTLLITTATLKPTEFTLWPNGNPDNWSVTGPEKLETDGVDRLSNVNTPTLIYYPAPNATPTTPTVILCPGGGYFILAITHEGTDIATYLNQNGINAAVLKYRLPREQDKIRHLPALQDAQRATRLLKSQAQNLNINPDSIGILGFSAGGHLAATLSTQYDQETYKETDHPTITPRPAFTCLIYPAYLTEDGTTNLKPEFKITPQTPPTFLVHTADDPIPAQNSLAYATALQIQKIPVSLHLYPQGGHGYGLNPTPNDLKNWPSQLVTWLKNLPKTPTP